MIVGLFACAFTLQVQHHVLVANIQAVGPTQHPYVVLHSQLSVTACFSKVSVAVFVTLITSL